MHILGVLTAASARDQEPRLWRGVGVGVGYGARGSRPALKSRASKVPGGADSHIMVFRPPLSFALATRRVGGALRGPRPL